MTQYILKINGDYFTVDCQDEAPLLWVLRDQLRLTGTRFGCGTGLCGACTVLLNGAPVHSCDTPMWSVGDKVIQTIEDQVSPTLRKVKACVSSNQAGQCGFCLSGIMMRAAAMIDSGVELTRDSVAENLDGHLCRCGAHNRIIDAVLQAGS